MDYTIVLPLGTLVVVILGFIRNAYHVAKAEDIIEQLRTNDMHELTERLNRIELKIDQHLHYHVSVK